MAPFVELHNTNEREMVYLIYLSLPTYTLDPVWALRIVCLLIFTAAVRMDLLTVWFDERHEGCEQTCRRQLVRSPITILVLSSWKLHTCFGLSPPT